MSKLWQYFLVIFFILPLCFLFPKITFADWTMPRFDFDKTGFVPYQISEKPQGIWVTENIGFVWNPPTVDSEGNIYLGTSAGGLTSLDKDGKKRWITNTYYPTDGVVLDNNNNIYYSSFGYPAKIYSYDQNGNKRWEYSLGGWSGNNIPTGIALSRNKDTLYVGIAYPSQTLLALNLDGTFKWQKNLNYNSPSSTPLVAPDGTIYVGTGTNYGLFALTDTGTTGTIKWYRYFIGSSDVHSLMLDSTNNIYLKSGGAIFSYDSLGTRRWIYQYPTYSLDREEDMAMKDNIIYAISKNNLIAVNTSGNLIWTFTAPSQWAQRLKTPVIDKDGNIYTGYGNILYVLNPDGTIKWEIPITGSLGKPVITDNNLIYIYQNPQSTSWDGYLHALGKITPTKTPVIFIPGVGGSELKVKDTVIWNQPDGHGGTYNHTYNAGEKVWVNEIEAIKPGSDDYFDILRLKSDGQNSEVDLELSGNIFSGAYGDTIQFFTDNGYTLDQNLFVFPYDWRKDITLTAPLLDQKIEDIKTQTGVSKVDIVAHSMGGLVARNYIADPTRALKVRKLITLGTPNLGAVKFLSTLFSGTCLYLEVGPFCLSIAPSETKDIMHNMIGGYELAPSQKYYDFYNGSDNNHPLPFVDNRDIDNNGVTGFLDYQKIKTLLTNLNYNTPLFTPTETFHVLDNNLINTNNVDVNIIAGSGQATLGQIVEDYYLNFAGIQIPKTDIRNINGDGTVPLFSASLIDGAKSLLGSAKIFYANQKHPDLVFNGSAMNLVKNILNGDNNLPAGISSTPYQFTGTGLSVHSPVLIHAYDQNGKHTGPLPNGDYEANIPESSYEVLGDAKFIWLPDSGIYNLKFEATNNGSFDFKIRNYKDDINDKTILYKDVPLTSTTRAEATFDTNSFTPPTLQVDQDGNGSIDNQVNPTSTLIGDAIDDLTSPQTTIKLTGNLGSNNWYKSDVTVELSATDDASGSGILKTQYSLNNGQTVQTYSAPFTITSEDINKLKVKSIDNAGNEESPKELEIKIDKTAPEVKISVDPDKQDLVVTGIDQNSTIVVKKDNTETRKKDAAFYEITDLAGNITRVDVRERDKSKQDRFAIYSIKYNDDEINKLPQNHFNVSYNGRRTRSNIDEQNFELRGETKIRIKYNQKKDQSTVIVKEPRQERVKEIKSGLVFLHVLTNKGQLETQY